ncbi:phosphatase PAP2 family protein [Rhodanobacter sp. FDAARGOS 1247]|uniref:phosphatase PAP2 family protein n=1 Tax=Rhodanobacter sp. FDAARGOS 1247 TaxID=2778082 RepID=UPI0019510B09|nr:phosphatase PAP2 family protein [Rhodanobacter sp. FDAARGOS 1247]QRP62301.1 phosphatase PAP2 family protein [Rhodanobacter sp. FDAARGOS 1247]
MNMPRSARWIGHAFAAELLLILVLGSVGAWRLDDGDLHAASVLGGIAWLLLLAASLAAPGGGWANWKGTLQFVACWLIFPLFKAIREVFIRHTADATLLALDRDLWGGRSLPEHLLGWERPWLSELLSSGYFLFYFVVLLPAMVFSVRRNSPEAKAFFLGLTLMYLVGFAGYLLVPAGGPYMAFPEVFPYPVHGGAMTALLAGVVKAGITGMDVFPSLHSGIGVYVLGFFALGGYRRIALLLAPIILALVVATLYLRYHYGIDVLCGIALAAAVLAFIQRYRKETLA